MIRNGSHNLWKPLLGAQIDTAHPLTQGIGYLYIFNEGTGTPFDLVSRKGTALTGSLAWVGSRTGLALLFNGTTTALTGTYASTAQITLAARIKTSTTGTFQMITSRDDGTNRNYQFRVNNANHIECILFNSAGTAVTTSGLKNVCDGLEHVVVMTWDGVTCRLYVDGVQDNSGAPVIVLNSNTVAPLIMGAYLAGSFSLWFNGTIVWEGAWNRAISAAEVAGLSEENYAAIATPFARRSFFIASGGGGGISLSGGIGISPRGMGIGI